MDKEIKDETSAKEEIKAFKASGKVYRRAPANRVKQEECKSCCETAAHKDSGENGACCHAAKETDVHKEEKGACHCAADVTAAHKEKITDGSCCHTKKERTLSPCGCPLPDDDGEVEGCCGKSAADTENKRETLKKIIKLSLSLVALILSLTLPIRSGNSYIKLLDFAWIAIIPCGIPIFRAAINGLKNKKITSSLLISIAITASLTMGIISAFTESAAGHGGHGENYFFVAGEVSFLMAIGEFIESFTVRKSRSAIKALISVKPTLAYLKTDNGYTETDVMDIRIGDIVLIRPNENVSVDGVITSGAGLIDQSNITGESVPAERTAGDTVYAGTRNLDTAFEVRVTKLSGDTTLSRLIEYVKKAGKDKAPIVRLADKWAGYLVPAACAVSVIIFLVSFFGFQLHAVEAINRAITILVVVCPCALALATPVAVSAGIGNASGKGILIKTGSSLEMLAKINTVAFDKTGTLTEGKPGVAEVFTKNLSEKDLIYYAASAEMQSEHPIAKAVIEYSDGNNALPETTQSVKGIGVIASVDGKEVKVIKLSAAETAEKEAAWFKVKDGHTMLAVLIDGKLEGVIAVTDTLREGAGRTVSELNADGYQTVMLTGDNVQTARAVSENIGIKDYYAELLPEDKVEKISALKADGKILMVGDGVNDAPALAMSDCSLAMGAMGNSVAIDTADISLMNSDITKIPYLFRLSKKTLFTIKANITLSLSLNVIAVFLGLFGILSVVSGAFMHNIGSVLVSVNAALLFVYKGKKGK